MGNGLSKYKEHRQILLDLILQAGSLSLFAKRLENFSEKEEEFLLDVSICEGVQGALYLIISDKVFLSRLYERLKSEYYKTIARWILLTEKFLPVAIEIEQKGIEFLILKGFVYSHCLYSSPGLRPIKDIDILIHHEDAGAIDVLLKKSGFNQTINDEMNYARYDESLRVVVDVHTKLMFPPADNLWGTLKEITIENHSFYTPDLENQMVYLISHPLIQHGYLRLIWVYDFLLFIEKHNKEFDPARFRELVSIYGLEIPFSHFFDFCKKRFSRTCPELDRFVIKRPQRKSLIVNAISKKSICASRPFDMGFIFYFFLITGFKRKALFLKEILLPGGQFLEKRHAAIPGKLMRRVFRPLFMVCKGIFSAVQWMIS